MGTNTSLSARISGNVLLRYLAAVLATVAAAVICWALGRIGVVGGTYVLLLLAVIFSAWCCGVGPAIAAIAVGLIAALFGFSPAFHVPGVPNEAAIARMAAFVLASLIVIFMGESRRRHNEALLKAQDELEARVQERTADLALVNQNLRELSARLMQLQDDERRRIARELHDSVGQTLAALAMNLSLVRGDVERLTSIAVALNDSENLVRDMSKEVRTISHLLHPPLLDEAGLGSALRWYVDGFAQRSRIKVELDMSEDFGRLPAEMETAIFRMVQECLTNIHRHSGSPSAKIVVRQRHDEVLVEISDKGRGIPPEKLEEMASSGTPGVGIRGMRERLRQLNGTLEINSNGGGTVVTVRLPIEIKSGAEDAPVVDPAAA